jgi:hypothetical protein
MFKQKGKRKKALCYRRPARIRPKLACGVLPRGPRAPPPLHALRDADRRDPLVSSALLTHGGAAAAPATVMEFPGPRARAHRPRVNFAIPRTPSEHALLSRYPLGHARGGRPPWPTLGRPLETGRVQKDGTGSFREG